MSSKKKDDAIKNDVWLKDQNSHNNLQWIEFFFSIQFILFMFCAVKLTLDLFSWVTLVITESFLGSSDATKELK